MTGVYLPVEDRETELRRQHGLLLLRLRQTTIQILFSAKPSLLSSRLMFTAPNAKAERTRPASEANRDEDPFQADCYTLRSQSNRLPYTYLMGMMIDQHLRDNEH